MKRLLCGSVVLAASLGLASCNGDPTDEGRGEPTRILAEPTVVMIDQGEVEEVIFTVTDAAGNPLAAEWELTETGPGITVERNPDFLPTTTGAPLESEVQYIVTAADAPTPSSFTVTAGELSTEVVVNVLPTAVVPATFSNATPALNEPVTITAEGYTFLPDAAVVIGGDSAAILSNDGTSVTFVPQPGTGVAGPANLENIAINFLPETPLTVPTAAEITVPGGPVGGTEDPATAPTVLVPEVGAHSVFFDEPDFTTTISHFYELTITEAGVYTITLDWDVGDDLDMYLCNADLSSCDFQAGTADHPEIGEYDLTPGTYFINVYDFAQDPDFGSGTAAIGAQIEFVVEHAAPAGALRKFPTPAVRKTRK